MQVKPVFIDADLIRKITGQKIKNIRLTRQLTQEQVAAGSGMTRTALCSVENGSKNLTAFSCMAFCLFFECTSNDLYPTIDEYNAGGVEAYKLPTGKRSALRRVA
jgi:DNA-binding XRE family transcriptional regulator